jgi:hypothetical protein
MGVNSFIVRCVLCTLSQQDLAFTRVACTVAGYARTWRTPGPLSNTPPSYGRVHLKAYLDNF